MSGTKQLRLLNSNPDWQRSVHDLLCLPAVYQYLADGEPPPLSVAQSWLDGSEHEWQTYGGGLWALQEADEQSVTVPLGLVLLASDQTLAPEGNSRRSLELTYLLHPSLWGAGLATRMAHSVMAACFEIRKVDQIWAGADAPNSASIKVMQRLNMRFKRSVDYPAGRGVEYQITRSEFDFQRFERLPVIC